MLDKNILETKQNIDLEKIDFNKVMQKYIKFLLHCSILFGILWFITFLITYLREYQFFPYNIFAIESLWLWTLAFVSIYCIFLVISMPFILIIYCVKAKENYFKLILPCIFAIFIIFLITIMIYDRLDDIEWIVFIMSQIALICFIAYIFITSYIDKNEYSLIVGVVVCVCLHFYFAIFYYQQYAKVFNNFFISREIAADNVKIYIKNENKFIHGKLIFRDNKYAYVRYCDNEDDCNNAKEIFSRQVPIEDVTIIKKVKKEETTNKETNAK